MLKDFQAEAVARFTKFEGRFNHFYLDTAGLVTVGVGCQVLVPFSPNAYGQWIERGTGGAPAYSSLVHQDYDSVRRMKPGLLASAYAQACMTRLTEPSIDTLLLARLETAQHELAGRFFDYEKIPNSKQFALIDLGFNLGVGRFMALFPNCVEAVRRRDWPEAAKESARETENPSEAVRKAFEERNAWAAAQFLEAA